MKQLAQRRVLDALNRVSIEVVWRHGDGGRVRGCTANDDESEAEDGTKEHRPSREHAVILGAK